MGKRRAHSLLQIACNLQIHTCGTPSLGAPERKQTNRKLQSRRGNIYVNLHACEACTCTGKAMVRRIEKKIDDNFY